MRMRIILFLSVLLTFSMISFAQQKGWFRGGTSDADKIQASPLLVDLNGDGFMEIIVPSFDDKLYIYNHDGTTFDPGSSPWPKELDFYETDSGGTISSPAVGDIDGDEVSEIVLIGDDKLAQHATVKVFETDGTLLGSMEVNATSSGKATPCIIDCYRYNGQNRHSGEEIVFRDGDGKVHVLYWNSSNLVDQYTTSTLNTCSDDSQRDRYGSQPITSSVAAVYLGNNETYIVIGSTDNKVYRWKITSTSSTNWSVDTLSSCESSGPSSTWFISSAALVDLDDDSNYEIVIGCSNDQVYVWNSNGTLRSGWPKSTTQPVISSPAIANLDGDNDLEIVIGCDDGLVYAWNPDGTTLSGWPKGTLGDIFGSPVIAELDGNAGLEVVATSLDGYMYAWTNTGTTLSGWPKRLNTTIYSSPVLGDIHGGGRMAVVTGGYDGRVFVFDLTDKSLDVDAGWQQFRGGPKRRGNIE